MKYKSCCNKRCLVYGCKTREDGGCLCVCILKDNESTILHYINMDRPIWNEKTQSFYPDINENDYIYKNLKRIKEKLKEYEVEE